MQDLADIAALEEGANDATNDMSREAVTARLKLASQLRRLCLSLGTATMKAKSTVQNSKTSDTQKKSKESVHSR